MKDDDFAVSPVIGTILLVAITVVLVAIIAAVVMGIVNQPQSKEVALLVYPDLFFDRNYDGADRYYGAISIIIYGGKDVNDLKYLNISLEGADFVAFSRIGSSKYLASSSGQFDKWGPISSKDIIGMKLIYHPFPMAGPITDQSLSASTLARNKDRIYDNSLVIVTGTFKDGTEQVLYKGRISVSPAPVGSQSAHDYTPSTHPRSNYPESPNFV